MTRKRPMVNDDCKHLYTSVTWVWGDVYHCWDCGELLGEDDDTEED